MGSLCKAAACTTIHHNMYEQHLLLILLLSPFALSTEWQPLRPPSLAEDTLVNKLLSQNREKGGLNQLEPETELVSEHPHGSGRVIVLQSGPEFVPEYLLADVPNDKDRGLIELNEVGDKRQNYNFMRPKLSWPGSTYRDI